MKNTQVLFEKANNVDAILVSSETNRKYFTGFDSTFGYLILLPQKNIFLTDMRYFEMASVLKKDGVEVLAVEGGKKGIEQVLEILLANNVKRLGFEDTKITVNEFQGLSKTLSQFELVPVGESINFVRRTKTDEEIQYIKSAQAMTDKAFLEILKKIKAGVSEHDIAIELEYTIKKLGGGMAFDTIVASGENSSKPHAHPTKKLIEAGDVITIDFGASCNGYCSDMTRTIFVGEPKQEILKIYNVVLAAQKNAIEKTKCGMTGKQIDAFARDIIVEAGFGEYFTHSTGHSLGIDIHEEPRASFSSDDIFTNNTLVTIEPGIYIPSVGGVRIEDLILIKENQTINLTKSDKNIIIL